jgi:hypothetical protein
MDTGRSESLPQDAARTSPATSQDRGAPPQLTRISRYWAGKAAVRGHTLETGFDPDRIDFLPELLPFHRHPHFEDASSEVQRNMLSCAWLAFNAKTIDIEKEILIQGCLTLYDDRVPGIAHPSFKRTICETLTDEAYHVLLTQQASDVTRRERSLVDLRIPRCAVVRRLEAYQSCLAHDWQKTLTLVAAAIVTEVFISGHLRSLARAENVQPLHVTTTKAHLADELTHSCIFKELAKALYEALRPHEREFFAQSMPRVARWFADADAPLWLTLLEQTHFRHGPAMLRDCCANGDVDCSELVELMETLGVMGMAGRFEDPQISE